MSPSAGRQDYSQLPYFSSQYWALHHGQHLNCFLNQQLVLTMAWAGQSCRWAPYAGPQLLTRLFSTHSTNCQPPLVASSPIYPCGIYLWTSLRPSVCLVLAFPLCGRCSSVSAASFTSLGTPLQFTFWTLSNMLSSRGLPVFRLSSELLLSNTLYITLTLFEPELLTRALGSFFLEYFSG